MLPLSDSTQNRFDLDREETAVAAKDRKQRTRKTWLLLGLVSTVLLLFALPPLLSVSRYQRRIASSMSQILGRPVHLDRVSLHLLPFPSFTLENLVIEEREPFGAEPLLRASTVDARLRVWSLWRRRVEFSRITFHDPSVNLVRTPQGQWNLEGILLQTAHLDAAPTSQAHGGVTPRFPYIEATGARVNLKAGAEKLPFSLTEADFALWLPEPQEWRMRLHGRPIRTDTSASDTGMLQMEATLRRGPNSGEVPLDLRLSWTGAPLGEASLLLTGEDRGVRGGVSVQAHLAGTLDHSALTSKINFDNLHRSDFVPDHALDVDVNCAGTLSNKMHALDNLDCRWPLAEAPSATITLRGNVPDLVQPRGAMLQLAATRVPAGTALSWLRVASARIRPSLTASGELSLSAAMNTELSPLSNAAETGSAAPSASRVPALHSTNTPSVVPLQAKLQADHLALASSDLGAGPVSLGPTLLAATSMDLDAVRTAMRMELAPTVLHLGDEIATLQGSSDSTGYTLRLSGVFAPAALQALGSAVPQFGDGLMDALGPMGSEAPEHQELSAKRNWGGPQVWTRADATPSLTAVPSSRVRRR